MPVRGDPENLLIGLAPEWGGGDIQPILQLAASERVDYVSIPLAAQGGQGRGADFRPSVESCLSLDGQTWQNFIVGILSEGLDPDTASSLQQAEERRESLETELRWATHLGLRAVLLPPPAGARSGSALAVCGNYARAVGCLLQAGLYADIGVLEGTPPPVALRVPAGGAGWKVWNRFRTLCDYHHRLAVALEFSPDEQATDKELERWLAEPVRFILLPSNAFLTNKQGFPVLPKRHKALLLQLFRNKVEVIVAPPTKLGGSEDGLRPRLDYVARLFQGLPALSAAELFSYSHLDTLQAPLQPLADNLESETYQLFEADPVKYARYEDAVHLFLTDRVAAGGRAPFTIMVLGAGRGPLVASSLRAAERAEVEVAVWAVEKNPNAVHALRHRKRIDPSWHCVAVVAEDMRVWKAPRKAHVIVSELLGSFGDNELSPECIDGAQQLLLEDGVCIPQSYTSSLAPVSTPTLWADARGRGGGPDLETAYVVQFHRACYPAGPAKDCFEFRHPNWSQESNDRYIEISWEVEVDSLVHGFAGYFDCQLYRDVRISIKPETFSVGMFSWFPMYFPLQSPVLLQKGQTLCGHWWRRHDRQKVWYEWCLSEPAPSPIQNLGGRSWPIGLF